MQAGHGPPQDDPYAPADPATTRPLLLPDAPSVLAGLTAGRFALWADPTGALCYLAPRTAIRFFHLPVAPVVLGSLLRGRFGLLAGRRGVRGRRVPRPPAARRADATPASAVGTRPALRSLAGRGLRD